MASDSTIKFKDLDSIVESIQTPSNKCRLDTDKVIPFFIQQFKNICNLKSALALGAKKNEKHRNMAMRVDISNRRPQIQMPLISEDMLVNCGQDKHLIILSLVIILPGFQGHQNLVIINTKTHEIERFEPHGATIEYTKLDIDSLLKVKFKEILPNYHYISPLDYCPKLGPQSLDELQRTHCDHGGYCVVWSILYGHLRLLNPDFTRNHIVDYLVGVAVREQYLRKYIAYIDMTINDSELESLMEIGESFDDIYVGDTVEGLKHGHGVMKYANGNVYEGEWYQDAIQGSGQMQYWYFPSIENKRKYLPDIYVGQWQQNMKSGLGQMTYNSERNNALSMASHEMAVMHKFGDLPPGFTDFTYEGHWKDNHYHGQGQVIDNKGNQYIGQWQWQGDLYTVVGTIKYINGNIYEGSYTYDSYYLGQPYGTGKLTHSNGVVEEQNLI